jgi:hypothetical protein
MTALSHKKLSKNFFSMQKPYLNKLNSGRITFVPSGCLELIFTLIANYWYEIENE